MAAVERLEDTRAGEARTVRTHEIGQRLKELRTGAGETLATLARKSGISAATLSKIENDKVSPTFSNLVRLAEALNIQLNDLIMATPSGDSVSPRARIAVTRASEVNFLRTPNYDMGALCTDILNKRMNVLLNRIHPQKDSPMAMVRHPGEELIFVTKGSVDLHTEHYRPVRLEEGDCAYFDSEMSHYFVSATGEAAEALMIWLPPGDLSQPEILDYVRDIFGADVPGEKAKPAAR